jgi:ferric-dicitrate binding protein FerR (iron transport regulator)
MESKNEKEKFQRILKSWETPFARTPQESWNELESKLSHAVPVRRMNTRRVWQWAAAAVAVIALGAGMYLSTGSGEMTQYATANGETSEVSLPDQSQVWLNGSSSIAWSDSWDERAVELSGQAFFRVSKGNTFTVNTAAGSVEVMGTSFDVNVTSSGLSVECHTGKVRVSASSGELTVLSPGERVDIINGSLKVSAFVPGNPVWLSEELEFVKASPEELFQKLGTHFGVEMVLEENVAGEFTGSVNTASLDEALQVACLPLGLSYEVDLSTERVRIFTAAEKR